MSREARALAVALHRVEPVTFERCALIRDWLDDHGVDRVTLVLGDERPAPDLAHWLADRARRGDAVRHRSIVDPPRPPCLPRVRAALAGDLLRLDLEPAHLERPRDVAAVESLLRGARRRRAITYDELGAGAPFSDRAA